MNAIKASVDALLQIFKYPLFIVLALQSNYWGKQLANCLFLTQSRVPAFIFECILICALGFALLYVSSYWRRIPLPISIPLAVLTAVGIVCETNVLSNGNLAWHVWLLPWIRMVATILFIASPPLHQSRNKFFHDENILFLLIAIGCILFHNLCGNHFIRASLPWVAFFLYGVAAIRFHYASQCKRKQLRSTPRRILKEEVASEEDKIGFSRLQQSILKCIRGYFSSDAPEQVLGLFGPWGSGKTHLLAMVEKELIQPKEQSAICTFANVNLWQISDRDELWQTTCTTLEQAYGIQQSLFQHICKRLKALGHFPAVDSWSAVAHVIFRWSERSGAESVDMQRESMTAQDLPVVLLFDNVERVKLPIIRELLPLVERLKQLPKLFIILSVAEDELVRKFTAKRQHADAVHGHLLKLVDTVVYMPVPNEVKVRDFFRELCDKYAENTIFLKRYAQESQLSFDTPRQIYRAAFALKALEAKRFSETQHFIKDEGKERAYPFIQVAYTTELIHLFYPRAFEALRDIPQRWLTYVPPQENNGELPPDEEDAASMVNEDSSEIRDLMRQPVIIERAILTRQKGENPPILAKVRILQEYRDQRLFQSLMKMLNKRSAIYLSQALELQYLDIHTFSEGQCDAVVCAEAWLRSNSTMKDLINRDYPADFRPATEICLSAIARHCAMRIHNVLDMVDATPYIRALLHLLSSERDTSNMDWETFLTADMLEWSLLDYACRLKPQSREFVAAWNAMHTWIIRCSFNTLHFSINFLQRSLKASTDNRIVYTPLAGKMREFNPNNYNYLENFSEWMKALGKHYAYTILELLNGDKSLFMQYGGKDYLVYHANEVNDDNCFLQAMQEGVSMWIQEHPTPAPCFFSNFLSLLEIPHNRDASSPSPCLSATFAKIYELAFRYCSEHIQVFYTYQKRDFLIERVQRLQIKLTNSPETSNPSMTLFQETLLEPIIRSNP